MDFNLLLYFIVQVFQEPFAWVAGVVGSFFIALTILNAIIEAFSNL